MVLSVSVDVPAADRSGVSSGGLVIGSAPFTVLSRAGDEITFGEDELKVWFNGNLLKKGRDYKVAYKNNKSVFELENGESFSSLSTARKALAPQVIVTGSGSYEGSVTRNFQITSIPVSEVCILSDPVILTKESSSKLPKLLLVKVKENGKVFKLKEGRDFRLSLHRFTRDDKGNILQADFENETQGRLDPGEYLINIHGIGGFGGSLAGDLSDAGRCPVLKVLSDADYKAQPSLNQAVLSKKLPELAFLKDPETSLGIVRSKEAVSLLADGKIKVKAGGRVLVYGEDFIVDDPSDRDDSANRYPGGNNYIDLLPGPSGALEGSKRLELTITGTAMKGIRFDNLASTVNYNGTDIPVYKYSGNDAPAIDNTLTLNRLAGDTSREVKLLKKDGSLIGDASYTIKAEGTGGMPGTLKLTFTGIPEYGLTGSVVKKIKITKRKLNSRELTFEFGEGVDAAAVPYSKAGARPDIVIRWTDPFKNERILERGSDYTVSYSSNDRPGGTGYVSIKGMGAFDGSLKNVLNFKICEAELSESVLVSASDRVKKANSKLDYYRSVPVLTDGGRKLVLGKDYEYAEDGKPSYSVARDAVIEDVTWKAGDPIEASDYVPAGLWINVQAGIIPKEGSGYKLSGDLESLTVSADFHTGTKDIGSASVKIRNLPFEGTGRAVIPQKSDFRANGLSENDFEILSCEKNTKVGTASVIIHGLRDYCGTGKCSFKITKGGPKEISNAIPVEEGEGFEEVTSPDEDKTYGGLETCRLLLSVEKGTFSKNSSVKVTSMDINELASIGGLEEGRFEKIISPMRYSCEGYDKSAFGGEVVLTLPIPDAEDISRYVFVYFDEANGELRYLYPDRIDKNALTMSLALPHFSAWWGARLSVDEQIDAFLDQYCMQQAVSNGKYKNGASDLAPYVRQKAQALGLTKEAAEDLVQAVVTLTAGSFEGKSAGLAELGIQHTSTLIRGVYDKDSDSIVTGMSDVADAAIQKCWQELKYSERGMSVFTDEAIGAAAGNANALSRMVAHFLEGESGFEDGMKELGGILQGINPGVNFATKGARFLASCANTSFVYWKASEVEELYQIYKRGCKDFWGNEVIPGDKESFLEYLNYASGFTKAKGINRFYNMDKIEELYERLKFTEFKGKAFSELSPSDRDKLEKYAEDGLMEYFELRKAQEKDADEIRLREREIIETMLDVSYGALRSDRYNEFFGEDSEEGYDVTFRLQRLINIRQFLSEYVDQDALEKGWADGGVNWGDLLNNWMMFVTDKNNTREMAIDEFINYLDESGILKKSIKKKNNNNNNNDDPPPEIKTGLEQEYDDNGVLLWENFYRNDGTKEWYKYYEGGVLKYHAEYDEKERVIHERRYDLKTKSLQFEDFYEYEGDELIRKLRRHYSLSGGGLIEEFEFTPATKDDLEAIGYEGDEERYIVKRINYYEEEGVVDPKALTVRHIRYAVYDSCEMTHDSYDGYLSDYYEQTWHGYYEDGSVERDMMGFGTYWTETDVWYEGGENLKWMEYVIPEATEGTITYYWKGGGKKAEEYYGRYVDSEGNIQEVQNFMTQGEYQLNIWDPKFDNPWTLWHQNGQTASTIYGTYSSPEGETALFECELNRTDYNEGGARILSSSLTTSFNEEDRTLLQTMKANYSTGSGEFVINYDSPRLGLTNIYNEYKAEGYDWTDGHTFENWTKANYDETVSHQVWTTFNRRNGQYREWGYNHGTWSEDKGFTYEEIQVGKEKIPD